MPSIKERLLTSIPAIIALLASIPCLILTVSRQNSHASSYLLFGIVVFMILVEVRKIRYLLLSSKIPAIKFLISRAATVQIFTLLLIISMLLSTIRIVQIETSIMENVMYAMFLIILPIVIFKYVKKIWRFLSGKQYFIV